MKKMKFQAIVEKVHQGLDKTLVSIATNIALHHIRWNIGVLATDIYWNIPPDARHIYPLQPTPTEKALHAACSLVERHMPRQYMQRGYEDANRILSQPAKYVNSISNSSSQAR